MAFLPKLFLLVILLNLSTHLYANERQETDSTQVESTPQIDINKYINKCQVIQPFNYNSVMRSGYIRVFNNESDDYSSLYFAFFGKEGIQENSEEFKKTPLLIWFQGGPGSTSFDALFFENGPATLVKKDGIYVEELTKVSWTQKYHIMYIDQPIGTGNSYLHNIESLAKNTANDITNHFYQAIQNLVNDNFKENCGFFKNYFNTKTEKATAPVYFTGESYAGKYIPCFSKKILQENEKPETKLKLNLKGISIGDPFTSPCDLVQEVGAYMYSMGLVNFYDRIKLERIIIKLKLAEQNSDWLLAYRLLGQFYQFIPRAGGVYLYNIHKYYSDKGINPYDYLTEYFNYKTTKDKFKVPLEIKFVENSKLVEQALKYDLAQNTKEQVEFCINYPNFKVLIYQGQNDLVVSSVGTMKWIDELKFPGSNEFLQKEYTFIKSDQEENPIGYMKKQVSADKTTNFVYYVFYNAGHMVPEDQPEHALKVIDDFIQGNY